MRYGYFDDEMREYVIQHPDTPLPWSNYLGCEDFISMISNTGGGYAFYQDAKLRRLTRFRYNSVPADTDGRFLYLRDDATGEAWSPNWQPMRRDLEDYRCRQGLGYTVIAGAYAGIRAETTYFVPLGETLEIWSTTVENQRQKTADLSLIAAVEFCLWNALDDATNFQRNLNIGEVAVHGRTIFHLTEYRERRNHFASFACSEYTAGFDTQREAFLGAFRDWSSPAAVERGALGNSIGVGGSPIGAHHVRLRLEPGESRRLVFVLGYHENLESKFADEAKTAPKLDRAAQRIARFTTPETVDAEFARLKDWWTELTGVLRTETPQPEIDRMVNTWNAYQTMMTFAVSRSASRYEAGIGRGIGFRDANQDLLGCVHLIPERARERLLDLASTQLPSGGAYHQYQPLTKKGNDDIGSGFNDDPLWLVLSASAYIKETGDWAILDEVVPYDNDPSLAAPMMDHLCRAAAHTLNNIGPHNLPLIGRADWNDCLNLNCHSMDPDEPFQTAPMQESGVAESVLIAAMFCMACAELEALSAHHGVETGQERWRAARQKMEQAIDRHGWDGSWYLRAYDASGKPIGSHRNAEGRIFIETQGMCVMAGLGLENGRAKRALDSVAEHLATDHGLMLHQPAFTAYRPELGEISSYPPGYKENASIFCHTNPWVIIAETLIGRGDRAFDYAQRINPAHREAISEVHQCEPYVYAQTIVGRDAVDHGKARNSWLTGTSAWSYVAMTQWILGLRAEYDGLRVDPCIPSEWPSYRVVRHFRGATYDIRIDNPESTARGVRSVHVDGVPLSGTLLPAFQDGAVHQVVVVLGGTP